MWKNNAEEGLFILTASLPLPLPPSRINQKSSMPHREPSPHTRPKSQAGARRGHPSNKIVENHIEEVDDSFLPNSPDPMTFPIPRHGASDEEVNTRV